MHLPDEQDADFKKFFESIIKFAQETAEPELRMLSFKSGADGDAPSPMPAYAVCSGDGSPLGSVFNESIPAVEAIMSKEAFRPWLSIAESGRRLRELSPSSGPWLDQKSAA